MPVSLRNCVSFGDFFGPKWSDRADFRVLFDPSLAKDTGTVLQERIRNCSKSVDLDKIRENPQLGHGKNPQKSRFWNAVAVSLQKQRNFSF